MVRNKGDGEGAGRALPVAQLEETLRELVDEERHGGL